MGTFRIREQFKLLIWNAINPVQKTLHVLGIIVSLTAMVAIVYFYGFPQTNLSRYICNLVIYISLIFYVVKYLLMFIFNKHSFQFLAKNKGEGIVVAFLLIWYLLTYILDINFAGMLLGKINVAGFNQMVIIGSQLFFFLLMFTDLIGVDQLLVRFRLGPAGSLMGSFFILITLGTIILMMPEMTINGISLIDALFMATSATCITGLSSIDIPTVLTMKGQLVLLILVQLGGLDIVCFATFFTSYYAGGATKYRSMMKELVDTNNSKSLTKEIFLYTFVIEIIGFIAIFAYLWSTSNYSHHLADNVYLAAFHSIACFNNAGFCIVDGGMQNSLFVHDYYLQTITILMTFLGGIGFLTIHDVVNTPKFGRHSKSFWNQITVSSKVVIKLSFILWIVGALCFFIFERNNVNSSMNLLDQIFASFFTSLSCRSHGFNIVDIGALNISTLIIMIILMTIGTASVSTGGGIKLSTFYILLKSASATIKNKHQVTINNRAISYSLVNKSYLVLLFTVSLILIGCLVLSLSDPEMSFMQIFFEITSACGTVGLSMGITPSLSVIGKLTITILMYIGRITVLTLVLSVAKKAFTHYSVAKTSMNI